MEKILAGSPFTLVPNEIYALPGQRCMLFCEDNKAALQQSNDYAFTSDAHIPLVEGMCELAGAFIRNVGATNMLIMLRYY